VLVLQPSVLLVQELVSVLFFGALVLGTSRNPSLKDELFRIAILGFALTEAIALFALMMGFLILFAL
jgi:F-type H+-transporting ATPase subunit c